MTILNVPHVPLPDEDERRKKRQRVQSHKKRRSGRKKFSTMTPAQRSAYEERNERRKEAMLAARAAAPPGLPVVIPFKQWCALLGISKATGHRIIASGKITVTELSARRIGIRSDHHLAYLDACAREAS
jgi:hypothetical protein